MKQDFKNALEDIALGKESEIYIETHRNLKRGIYDEAYVDTIHQGKEFSASSVIAFSRIHNHIKIGNIARLTIGTDEAPLGDKAIKQNNKVLLGLSPLFDVTFLPESGYGAWSDGYLSAKGDAIFERTVSPYEDKKYQKLDKFLVFDLYNQHIPLEVGYTEGHITYLHLMHDGAVARWAYGSRQIVVMIVCNPISEKARSRDWKYHKATPLDFAIAKSQFFYNEPKLIATIDPSPQITNKPLSQREAKSIQLPNRQLELIR
jgi:hypothetical protein